MKGQTIPLEIKSNFQKTIFSIGKEHPNGTYCLRIALSEPFDLVFGRFKKGKLISLNAGEYVYIGSALAKRGSTTLGNRLRRHTSRSQGHKSHKIQRELLKYFNSIGISYTKTSSPKKMFWNIDYLLDLPTAEIISIIFTRNPNSYENIWSEFFEKLHGTIVFEKGLGANDSDGHTHIQYSSISEKLWKKIPYQLPR